MLTTSFVEPQALPQQINNTFLTSKDFYVTDWEAVHSWSEQTTPEGKLFYTNRKLTDVDNKLLGKSVVLTFVKGYNFSQFPLKEKPVLLPFEFFLPEEGIKTPISWKIRKGTDELQVGFRIPDVYTNAFQINEKKIQLRHFLFHEAFLEKNKITRQALHNMTYKQVAALAGVDS